MIEVRKKIILLTLPVAIIVILLVLFSSNGNAALNNPISNYSGSIFWDGLERTYIAYIPPSYDKNKSMPLVIALHGGGGTGKGMKRLSLGGFNTLADKKGFVVVYPDGTKRAWNDGRDERYSQADDVGFISALIDHLVKEFNVDSKRIYVTGMSNGAHMSMRLARELSHKIAAVAPVAYAMQEKYASVPVSTRPISVLVMTGTNDPLIPWEGGETPDPTGKRMLGRILSVVATVKVLLTHNECSPVPTIAWEPDKAPRDGTKVLKEVYDQCEDGTEVILYTIEGGGHTWPGGWQYLPEKIVGKTSRDIDANEAIWDFFKRYEVK